MMCSRPPSAKNNGNVRQHGDGLLGSFEVTGELVYTNWLLGVEMMGPWLIGFSASCFGNVSEVAAKDELDDSWPRRICSKRSECLHMKSRRICLTSSITWITVSPSLLVTPRPPETASAVKMQTPLELAPWRSVCQVTVHGTHPWLIIRAAYWSMDASKRGKNHRILKGGWFKQGGS